MVVFNPTKREIGAKIVFYGPALCGKTTNLQYIHKKLNPNQRGDLVSLATKDDRTLFFDFLPLDLGTVKGFKTRFHLYTVPGQVYYVSTRRAVLTGVDGVVFVADSQDEKMAENIESLEDLEKNLLYYGKKIDELPMILQYNKRDLENISTIEELNAKINKRSLPYIEASAVTGQGVMETLTMVSKAVLLSLEDSSKRSKYVAGGKPTIKAPPIPIKKPAPPEVPPPPPKPAEEPLLELAPEDRGEEIEKLKAERKADIDRLLKREEKISQEPTELLSPLEEAERIGADETIEIDEAEGEVTEGLLELGKAEEEIEPESREISLDEEGSEEEMAMEDEASLDFGEVEEKIESEAEEAPFELETSGEEIELEAEEESLEKEEIMEIETPEAQIKPEVIEEPGRSKPSVTKIVEAPEKPSGEIKGIEIVSWGMPQKISPASLKLPLVLKLNEIKKEAKINIIIKLEEPIVE